MDVKLVVVGGANEGDEFRIDLPAVLGRGRDVTLPLPHPLVSRRHCELYDAAGTLVVRDLGSTNGTFVGSERVEESELAHGQLLTIGTVTFRAFLGSAGTCGDDVRSASMPRGDATEVETATLARPDTTPLPFSSMPSQQVSERAK